MKIALEFIVLCFGIIMIFFGFQFKEKSKQMKNQEKRMEYKAKSILLLVFGCLYEVFTLLLFCFYHGDSVLLTSSFLIAFILSKCLYTVLYRYLLKKENAHKVM